MNFDFQRPALFVFIIACGTWYEELTVDLTSN